MRWIAAFLLIGSLCPAQTIASRRYAERLPEQYVFGPMTAIAPYNMAPQYTSVPIATLEPSALVYGTDNFGNVANWTQTNSPSCTLTVASNVGTSTCTGSTGGGYYLASLNLNGPTLWASFQVNSTGTGSSSYDNLGPCLMKDGANFLCGVYDHLLANDFIVQINITGTQTSLSSVNIGRPTAPYSLGLSLIDDWACVWLNTGSGWTPETCADTSAKYDFRASGNLTGWHPGIQQETNTTSNWTMSSFTAGAFGGIAAKNCSAVTYADNRPYMVGPVIYLKCAISPPMSNLLTEALFTYNVNTQTLAEIGQIFNSVDTSGGQGACCGSLIYDPGLNEYRMDSYVGGAATWYGAWSKTTTDPLAGGVVRVTLPTELTSIGTGGASDFYFACDKWNYSTGSCPHWIGTSELNSVTPKGWVSTSDPSANAFSLIGSTSCPWCEGNRIYRTAAGSGGVNYDYVVANRLGTSSANTGYGYENVTMLTYNDTNFGAVGMLHGQMPGTNAPGPFGFTGNPSQPQIFGYGNTEYMIGFDDTILGTSTSFSTMGDFVVSSAPKYAAQTNWPIFVNSTSKFSGTSAASITTSTALNIAAGNIVVVMCRTTTSVSSFAVSSSPSVGTFTGIGKASAPDDELFYLYGATAQTGVTFTCTPNISGANQAIAVMQFTPGFTTGVDFTSSAATGGSNVVYTSPSFSTTAAGLVIVCPDFNGALGASQPGFIGPYKAAFSSGATGAGVGCMSTVTPAAQSSITATWGSGSNSANTWNGAIVSFK